jgi:hypothetical protein
MIVREKEAKMETWLYFAAGGVFFLFIVIYLVVLVLWPEWVGITGKVALEAERSHRGGTMANDDLMDALHKPAGAKPSAATDPKDTPHS